MTGKFGSVEFGRRNRYWLDLFRYSTPAVAHIDRFWFGNRFGRAGGNPEKLKKFVTFLGSTEEIK